MSAQSSYDNANDALKYALDSKHVENATAQATIACALYLRAICEMLGTKFNNEAEPPSGADT